MDHVATEVVGRSGSATVAPKGLLARAVGVIVSPRDTYLEIAARPRIFGALLVILIVVATAQTSFLLTDVGKDALLDQQVRFMESFGRRVNDQTYEMMERQLQFAPYFTAAGTIVGMPIVLAALSGLIVGIFSAVLGGDATFKQVYAVVVHSSFLLVLQQMFANPLNYARQSMSSPTNLAVFFPFLDETSFAARLLGGIDLFFIWQIVNLAIGVGVLYKRKTGPIAATMFGIYFSVVLIIAAVRAVLSAG
jgi:hypothetical protein